MICGQKVPGMLGASVTGGHWSRRHSGQHHPQTPLPGPTAAANMPPSTTAPLLPLPATRRETAAQRSSTSAPLKPTYSTSGRSTGSRSGSTARGVRACWRGVGDAPGPDELGDVAVLHTAPGRFDCAAAWSCLIASTWSEFNVYKRRLTCVRTGLVGCGQSLPGRWCQSWS